jgi:adenosylmethionine-8-amino-7-oxononanoate aminotransferase
MDTGHARAGSRSGAASRSDLRPSPALWQDIAIADRRLRRSKGGEDLNRSANARSVAELDRGSHLHPFTSVPSRLTDNPPVIVRRMRGAIIEDENGRELIDAPAGLWYVNAGYGRREIGDAVHHQMNDLAYFRSFGGMTHEPVARLADRFLGMALAGMKRVLFGNWAVRQRHGDENRRLRQQFQSQAEQEEDHRAPARLSWRRLRRRQLDRTVERENLVVGAGEIGRRLVTQLRAQVPPGHALVGDIRACGFTMGVELVEDKAAKKDFAPECAIVAKVQRAVIDEGPLIWPLPIIDLAAMSPPFIIEQRELDECGARFGRALARVAADIKQGRARLAQRRK